MPAADYWAMVIHSFLHKYMSATSPNNPTRLCYNVHVIGLETSSSENKIAHALQLLRSLESRPILTTLDHFMGPVLVVTEEPDRAGGECTDQR